MNKTIPCRLSLIFARQAPVAVILRRGPKKWVEAVKWNTKTDAFEEGQWFYGRIYSERCGLSPDGKLLVYFAIQHWKANEDEGYEQSFTAVSRPPWLAPLAMWPDGATWGGGGRFIDNKTLFLAYGKGRTAHPGSDDTEIYMAPFCDMHHPDYPPTGLKIRCCCDHYDSDRNFRLPDTEYPQAEWFGRDHFGREIFIREGRLFRLVRRGSEERLLRDFNLDQRRRREAPAWAGRW